MDANERLLECVGCSEPGVVVWIGATRYVLWAFAYSIDSHFRFLSRSDTQFSTNLRVATASLHGGYLVEALEMRRRSKLPLSDVFCHGLPVKELDTSVQ